MAVAACTEAERFQEVVLQEKMWMFSELKQPNRVQLNIFTIPEDREASKMVFFAFPPPKGRKYDKQWRATIRKLLVAGAIYMAWGGAGDRSHSLGIPDAASSAVARR